MQKRSFFFRKRNCFDNNYSLQDATPGGKTAVKKVAASPAAVTVAKKTPAKKAESIPSQVATPVVIKTTPAKSVGRPPKNTPASQKVKPVKKTPLKSSCFFTNFYNFLTNQI